MTKGLTLRERQRSQTRTHLVETAARLFVEKGFASTSIDDLIEAAGMSRATLYSYFRNKDDILAAIVDRLWDKAFPHYQAFGELPDWSHDRVLKWLRTFARAWEDEAATTRAAMLASPNLLADAVVRRRQLVAAVLGTGEHWKHFDASEAEVRASMVVGVVESQLTQHLVAEEGEADDAYLGYVVNGIRALIAADRH
ncbi:TetR/AcrR family transcriptional regulator [Bacillus cereus]|uniref:TetR/AcrR family transcriptional regulator n=1 Tax=Bacillus cereus TaxID=1396 RepID=UPI0036731E13